VVAVIIMNALGLFRDDELVGSTARVAFITVFFLAQSQLIMRFSEVNRAATRARIKIVHKENVEFMQ
jgi:hypothetical protein